MTLTDRIVQRLKSPPAPLQAQVLEYVVFLEAQAHGGDQEDREWSSLSLSEAMRGIEDEHPPYSMDDLREVFS